MSFDYQDIVDRNNVEDVTKLGKKLGYKSGRARTVFTATGGKVAGAYALDLVIPKGAVVKRAWYKTLTTFTSATDAATIALKIVGANDVVSAIAISDVSNPWDAGGPKAGIPVTQTLSSWLTTTADSAVTATVAVEDLTAGKLVVFVEWEYFGDLTLT